tara:strand:+ start:25090 stop:26040 length:951 start_codon:yes stop_codon:yes gene_type:complete
MPIKNKLAKSYKHRNKWAKRNEIFSWRLYEHDIPDYPFIIDIYDCNKDLSLKSDELHRYAVIWNRFRKIDHEKGVDEKIDLVKEALNELGVKNTIFKDRRVQEDGGQYQKTNTTNKKFITKEGSRLSLVNLFDYLDTGLFLDHRPLRDIIFKESEDKEVLNLFSYTCMISVASALGNAKKVDSVDLSNNYLKWGEENFLLNELDIENNQFIQSDVLTFLETTDKKYDLIILDPPTFSNSKKTDTTLDIQRDHQIYINRCMDILRDNGDLYFSNNLRKFKLDENTQELYQVRDITPKTIPEDFRDKNIHSVYHIKHK